MLFKNRFSRRHFVHLTAFLLAGLSIPFLSQDRGVAGTSKVGIIKTNDRIQAVKRSLQLLQRPDLKKKRVLIKPNFNTKDPAPGSTHYDTLSSLIDEIKARGAEEIIIGERSGPPNTQTVMEEKGIFKLAEEKGVMVVNFDELKESDLVHFKDQSLHWRDGFHVPRILHEVDHIIATPCLKTHQFGGIFTMALKLAVGIIPKSGNNYMQQLHGSRDMRKMIAEINLAYRPDLFIVDGVEAFTSGGPSSGRRVQADVTLVSSDPVAVDAVGLAVLKDLGTTHEIMSRPIFSQEQIERAHEIGLGVSDPSHIELISDDEKGEEYSKTLKSILMEG